MGGYKLGWLSLVDPTLSKVHVLTLSIFFLKILNGIYVVIDELRILDEKKLNQTTFECTC
jgi:hypothetical protein